jgi:hypothetical protein
MDVFRFASRASLTLLLISAVGIAAENTPRMADGKPNLNGTWDNGGGIDFLQPQQKAGGSICVSGCAPAAPVVSAAPAQATAASAPSARLGPDRPRYRPEFAAKVKELEAKQVKFDPVLRCQPPGVPRIGPPDKIVQTAREIVFLYEDVSGPFFRIVPLVAGVRRIDDSESYLGDATGRWEGDSLVVETTNFNDLSWLTDDGAFHTSKLRVTERLTRNGNQMQWQAVASDPDVLSEPWQVRPRQMVLSATEMAEPAPCVEQDMANMVDDSHHDNAR